MRSGLKVMAIIGIVWSSLGILAAFGAEFDTETFFGILGMGTWMALGIMVLKYLNATRTR